jgi:hypothetical protein
MGNQLTINLGRRDEMLLLFHSSVPPFPLPIVFSFPYYGEKLGRFIHYIFAKRLDVHACQFATPVF